MRLSPLLIALGLLCVVPARADDIFTLTSGSNTVSFSLPDSAPSVSTSDAMQYTGLTLDVNGTILTNAAVDFYSASDGGGMEIIDLDPFLLNLEGSQMFQGTTTDPAFSSEAYALTSLPGSDLSGNVDVTVAAAPEPASLALLGTGLLGMFGLLRRRRA